MRRATGTFRFDLMQSSAATLLYALAVLPLVLTLGGCSGDLPVNQPNLERSDEVTLVFTGDVMLARNVEASVRRNDASYTRLFTEMAPYTQAADIAFCNLECAISQRGVTHKNKHAFRAPPESIEGLQFAGFDIVSLGNNHSLDFGDEAAADTLSALEQAGIRSVGMSTDKRLPQTPAILDAKGLKIGFLSYCTPRWAHLNRHTEHGIVLAEKDTLSRDIGQLRDNVDILVVSMHWGLENKTDPNDIQRGLANFMAELGVDIIAGHHPHVQQEPEFIGNTLVLFSMGNFVFDQRGDIHRKTRLYRVAVNKSGVLRAEYLPGTIARNTWQPVPDSGEFVPVARKNRTNEETPQLP